MWWWTLAPHKDVSAPCSTHYSPTMVSPHTKTAPPCHWSPLIGLVTAGDKTAYRREVASLVTYFDNNSLSLNTDKSMEKTVDMRKTRRPCQLLTIHESEVEMVSSFKFLEVHTMTSPGHVTLPSSQGSTTMVALPKETGNSVCHREFSTASTVAS